MLRDAFRSRLRLRLDVRLRLIEKTLNIEFIGFGGRVGDVLLSHVMMSAH